jgi:hypothetical protein
MLIKTRVINLAAPSEYSSLDTHIGFTPIKCMAFLKTLLEEVAFLSGKTGLSAPLSLVALRYAEFVDIYLF